MREIGSNREECALTKNNATRIHESWTPENTKMECVCMEWYWPNSQTLPLVELRSCASGSGSGRNLVGDVDEKNEGRESGQCAGLKSPSTLGRTVSQKKLRFSPTDGTIANPSPEAFDHSVFISSHTIFASPRVVQAILANGVDRSSPTSKTVASMKRPMMSFR